MSIDKFPGIKKVSLGIAYDNGMINSLCSEQEWLGNLDSVIGADGVYEADLMILDTWCLTLNDEEIDILSAGEDTEMQSLIKKCPKPELCGLFEDIFDS